MNGKVDNLQTRLTETSNDREIGSAFRENWHDPVQMTDLMAQNIVFLGGISVARGRDRHRWGDRLALPWRARVPTQKDIILVTLEWGCDNLALAEALDGATTVIGSVEGEAHSWQRSTRNQGREE